MKLNPRRWLVLVLFIFATSLSTDARAQDQALYFDPKAPLEDRVNDLFGRLTHEEKLDLISGHNFGTMPVSRLSVPVLRMVDAGGGVRGGAPETAGPATAFPAGVNMASSWDPELVSRIAQGIGLEVINKGIGSRMLLGPAINIQRGPLGGRNGEYFSEDPYLAGRLAIGYIQGLQSTGVAACVKHFACYNEEYHRYTIDVGVSERALREIYTPAFEAAVKEGHPWTVMSSYNQINGYKATANKYLMVDILKKCWGFDGALVSDWGGVQDTVGPLNAGNDLEMPGHEYMTRAQVEDALKSGKVSQNSIDDSVHRILRTIIRTGLLDSNIPPPDHTLMNSPGNQALSREAAVKSIVLLKNDNNILPLDPAKIHSLAIIGLPATDYEITAAGSPKVTPFYSINPLAGIRKRVGSAMEINYSSGPKDGFYVSSSVLRPADGDAEGSWQGEYFSNRNLEGTPALVRKDPQILFDWSDTAPGPGLSQDSFSVRWTGTVVPPVSGDYKLSLTADDGCRLFLDDKKIIDHWVNSQATPQTATVSLEAGREYKVRIEYFQAGGTSVARFTWKPPGTNGSYAEAAEAARKSDVALVFVTTKGTEGEGGDRPSMALPYDQDELVRAVAGSNKNTIVVLNNGTPVDMRQWIDQVSGLVETWFPGQEGGAALASILFGDANPSGKLPTTLARQREDYPDYPNFPGNNGHVEYKEGIYVGYRHFDKANIAPLFPFGFGLSYTTFEYAGAQLSAPTLSPDGSVTVSLNVTNAGSRDGAEVVQLYVHDTQPQIDKPVRELKGFQRVELKAGETKKVSFEIKPRALSYCDVAGKQWKADAGNYELQIGSSSRDIRLTVPLQLTGTFTEAIPFLEEQTPASPDPHDLAFSHPTTSSSQSKQSDYGCSPGLATDGNSSTYWRSQPSDPQWLAVDLGKSTLVNRVRVKWGHDRFGANYAIAYTIQISSDGQNWTDVSSTTSGGGGVEEIKFDPVSTEHVRIFCTKRSGKEGDTITSFEVFAP